MNCVHGVHQRCTIKLQSNYRAARLFLSFVHVKNAVFYLVVISLRIVIVCVQCTLCCVQWTIKYVQYGCTVQIVMVNYCKLCTRLSFKQNSVEFNINQRIRRKVDRICAPRRLSVSSSPVPVAGVLAVSTLGASASVGAPVSAAVAVTASAETLERKYNGNTLNSLTKALHIF